MLGVVVVAILNALYISEVRVGSGGGGGCFECCLYI